MRGGERERERERERLIWYSERRGYKIGDCTGILFNGYLQYTKEVVSRKWTQNRGNTKGRPEE